MPCFCQPSSVDLARNAVKLPWFLLEQTKHLTSVGDIHDPCTLTCQHHVPRHNVTAQHQAKQRLAVVPAFSFCRSLVACRTAENSDALVCFCQPSSVEPQLNAVKLPLFFVEAGSTASQTFERHVSCHSTTSWKTAYNSEDSLFVLARSCPSGLLCGKP